MKKALATLLSAGLISAAQAGSITLNMWNSDQLNASGDTVVITTTLIEAGTLMTIEWNDGAADSGLTFKGIDKLGFNYAGELTLISQFSSEGWALKATNSNIADFGRFSFEYVSPAFKGSMVDLVFAQEFDVSNFFDNNVGNSAVAHVRYDNDCSGFVGDGGPRGGAVSNPNCGGSTPVSEPGSIALLALGLMGLGVSRRVLKS